MNPENYFNKQPEENKKEESIKGDGFTIIKVEESSDIVRAREKKKKITEMDEWLRHESGRTKDFTKADHAEDMLNDMLKTRNPYSETLLIKLDGKFDKILRADKKPVYLGYGDNPEDLYQIAAEIEKKHPEYHFSFETDPEGKWMKYTVLKDEIEK